MKGIWNVDPPTPESRVEGMTIRSILAQQTTLCELLPDDYTVTDSSLGPVEDAPEKFVTHVTVEEDKE